MYETVTLLTLISRLPYGITAFLTCAPNTQFLLNGRLCFCDNRGRWSESNCETISRRQVCQPGQIIWRECNQCICQENGYLLCSNTQCSNDTVNAPTLHQNFSILGLRCTPFRSYHINCSLCVCPASGNTKDIRCVNDTSCISQNHPTDIASAKTTYCIPNVMYLTRCIQCWCTDRGYFDVENCVDKCARVLSKIPATKCIPGTLYRVKCNLCRCPENGVSDERLCVAANCNQHSTQANKTLRTRSRACTPHSFTSPRCMYCDCDSNGHVNENACIEIDCAKRNELNKYYSAKDTCRPGEMLPMCIECFCSWDGRTNAKYCSKGCSNQNKLDILEMVVTDSAHIIERSHLKSVKDRERCAPKSVYVYDGKYCLCPENGNTNLELCTSVSEKPKPDGVHEIFNKMETEYQGPCEPNTFVEFDCNTCYCNRTGRIDPKWCTYDDCEGNRLLLESQKIGNPAIVTDLASGACRPSTISKVECNFCICPESGILKEQACTHKDCTEIDQTMFNDRLTCEPLAYYEVDCNICYCPRDGIKNIAKCTKNQCEKSILRSDSCVPGQLFSEDCNLCVCPPDGHKMGRACTDHVCSKVPSLHSLELSDSLLNIHVKIDKTRSLDQCFRGEEFVEGCKICTCTELGLKTYATCDSICDEKNLTNSSMSATTSSFNKNLTIGNESIFGRLKRAVQDCYKYNVSHSAERKECTPGTMYIIRCRQCICPYLGNINNFCRPLPKNMYCEQAFPNYNYLPMGRRKVKANTTVDDGTRGAGFHGSNTSGATKKYTEIKVQHAHTVYNCERRGTIMDRCFICECEKENVVIEEHCFRSDHVDCKDAAPTFLVKDKVEL